MSLPVRFHPLAEEDMLDAWSWYEGQLAGLGNRFLAVVGASIDRASQWPNAGSPAIESATGDIVERRIPTSGFPWVVRYRIVDGELVIMAVYHQHRHPRFGSERTP